jgi:hypothetical protein
LFEKTRRQHSTIKYCAHFRYAMSCYAMSFAHVSDAVGPGENAALRLALRMIYAGGADAKLAAQWRQCSNFEKSALRWHSWSNCARACRRADDPAAAIEEAVLP